MRTADLLELVTDPTVLRRFDEPVELASGEKSRVFIDGKRAVVNPEDLELVGGAMVDAARAARVAFAAVGGLALGAVPYTFAVAQAAPCRWFLIRKESKGRGTDVRVEGAPLGPGTRVMLVDDVVTTGGSIRAAYDAVQAEGATVVFATTLVDRGEQAAAFFRDAGVPYQPLLTYRDLDIEPVGGDAGPDSASAPS